MTQQLCPEPTVLAAFGRGELTEGLFEHIASHVADCPSCQQVLAQLDDGSDALLAGLRHVRAKDAATPWPDTQPTQHNNSSTASAVQTPPGYELLGEVGRGGMGMVQRARDNRLNREVAIKLLREDYPTDSAVCARFVAEAQITGQLQHPGIPAVHELGYLPDGRPFLVMKLVKGRTLQELLRERGNPGQERGRFLAIFEQVCQAVGYAHAHRVIHRDLKPGNVMVGAFGEVQVMDWGLAKLLTAPASAEPEEGAFPETLLAVTAIETPQGADSGTRTGSVMGTPAYMSPEQAGGEIRKLDARSDVFGLGAILCASLTGVPPYRGKDANAIRLQAVRGELTETLARLDACGAEPELVALCKRCLAFRQEDRPADGGAVATEVARIRQAAEERARRAELERAEVLVREAEQRKRRRVWLALAACLLMGLLASTTLGVWANYARQQAELARTAEAEARQAEKERAEGERQARLEAVAAKEQAQKRLKQIEKGNEILASIFTDLDIHKLKQEKEPLEAVLAKRLVKASEQLEGEAVGDPLVVAHLQHQLGRSLLILGHPRAAIVLSEKARATRLDLLGADHPETLLSTTLLGTAYKEAGQLGKALKLHEETLRQSKAALGDDALVTLTVMNNLALSYQAAGRPDKALPLFEETLRQHKAKLGEDHPLTLTLMNNLARACQDAGQLDKALTLYEETLRRRKAILGADHADTIGSMNNLAAIYATRGQVDKAVPLWEETLRLYQTKVGSDHPDALTIANNLAWGYQATGQLDKALPLHEETLRRRKAKLGADHPQTLESMGNLAWSYQAAGQWDKALLLHEETLRRHKAKLGNDHPNTLVCLRSLAIAYCESKQSEKALPLFAEYFEGIRKQVKPNDPRHVGMLATASQNLLTCERYKEAELYLRECQAIREKSQPDDWSTFDAQSMLGGALLGQKKYTEAEPLLVKGYHGMKDREAKIPKHHNVRLAEAVTRLVHLYDAWNKPAEAAKWRKELAQYQTTGNKPKH